jgi:hypothetical protein
MAPAGSGRLQGCGARGARRLLFHVLHSAGRNPAAGSCRLQGCGSRVARWLRNHVLHSAGRRPAAGGFGRLQGCCAREACRLPSRRHLLHPAGSSPAAGCRAGASGGPSGSRLRPVAGLRCAGHSRVILPRTCSGSAQPVACNVLAASLSAAVRLCCAESCLTQQLQFSGKILWQLGRGGPEPAHTHPP